MAVTRGPLYLGATRERRRHMFGARVAMERYRATSDPIYLRIARIHVRTARTFNRHAWKGMK